MLLCNERYLFYLLLLYLGNLLFFSSDMRAKSWETGLTSFTNGQIEYIRELLLLICLATFLS